jgi:hypothetical protein
MHWVALPCLVDASPLFLTVEGQHVLDYNLLDYSVLGYDAMLMQWWLVIYYWHFGEFFCLHLQGSLLQLFASDMWLNNKALWLVLLCKDGLVCKHIVACFCYLMLRQPGMREKNVLAQFICSSPSSKLCCYLSLFSSKQTSGFVSHVGKQLMKGTKVLNTVYVNEAVLYSHIFRWFKRFLLQHEALKMIQGLGGAINCLKSGNCCKRL